MKVKPSKMLLAYSDKNGNLKEHSEKQLNSLVEAQSLKWIGDMAELDGTELQYSFDIDILPRRDRRNIKRKIAKSAKKRGK